MRPAHTGPKHAIWMLEEMVEGLMASVEMRKGNGYLQPWKNAGISHLFVVLSYYSLSPFHTSLQ